MFKLGTILRTLALAGVLGLLLGPDAEAQTARNLVCKGCVGAKDLKKKAVRTNKIRNNAVTSGKIAANAVGSSEVASDSIPAMDLSNEAGAGFVGGDQFVPLITNTDTVVRFVTITAPSSGVVVVNASGYFSFTSMNPETVVCTITTATATDDDNSIAANEPGFGVSLMPFAGTRGFAVGPGSTTFNLVCREILGNVNVVDTQITAIFLPTTY